MPRAVERGPAGSGPAPPGGLGPTPSPDPALTGEARRAAADVALGPVVAEGRRQPRDEPVVSGPGALHAEAAGEAGAAAALADVLLAAGARVPCGDTGTRSGCDTVGSNPATAGTPPAGARCAELHPASSTAREGTATAIQI